MVTTDLYKCVTLSRHNNGIDALYQEEEALQDNLERNLRILQAHRLKASDNERKMRKKVTQKSIEKKNS